MNFEEPKGWDNGGSGENSMDGPFRAAKPQIVANNPLDQLPDPYVEYLQSLRGKKIYLKPYWGNSGDELIWMGTQLVLHQLGLERVINPKTADVILWPGGNPTMWQTNLAGWQDCWQQWPGAEFVVGPAGFQGSSLPWRELLKKSPAKISGLFARDPVSYENLRRLELPSAVNLGLGHDPALYLRNSKWAIAQREACTNEYVLASFRADHESTLQYAEPHRRLRRWPVGNVYDFYNRRQRSRHYRERFETVRKIAGPGLPLLIHDAPMTSFYSFVECLARASQVHTDRLHCMILALLLGKPVYAYATSYSKLEDVYRHSIQPWATVTLVPDPRPERRR